MTKMHADQIVSLVYEMLAALEAMTPPMMPPWDAPCHVGLVPQAMCLHCTRIVAAHGVIKKAKAAL